MGHVLAIRIFDSEMSEKEIVAECHKWQRINCDREECGYDGPMWPIHFTSHIYESRKEATDYLNTTFGDYDQTAVRFKENGKTYWAVACEVHH